MRVGLSGTGRIGRLIIRKALSQAATNLEWMVVNTTSSAATLAHLLQYDTVHGKWDARIEADRDELTINGTRLRVVSERNPAAIPWREHGIQLVIDATGRFTERHAMEMHLAAGAECVLLTAPSKHADLTIVMGVNEECYDPAKHRLLSAASCTTNCAAPILKLLDESFGIRRGWLTTVHAYTNDQNHVDNNHKDLRRARACASSIIPTATGVSQALIDVLPKLAPHMKGISVRVPTQNVSLLDLQLELKRPAQAESVRQAFLSAIDGKIGAYVDYNEMPLVSADYIGNEKSAIVDGLSIMTQGDQVKLLAWYDNEWAYACRVLDVANLVAKRGNPQSEGGEPCLITTE